MNLKMFLLLILFTAVALASKFERLLDRLVEERAEARLSDRITGPVLGRGTHNGRCTMAAWCKNSNGNSEWFKKDVILGTTTFWDKFSQKSCLAKCADKSYTACEYYKPNRRCTRHTKPVNGGEPVKRSNYDGHAYDSNYVCMIASSSYFVEGLLEQRERQAREAAAPALGTWECDVGVGGRATGTVFRRNTIEKCKEEFAASGKSFTYYRGSGHCQAVTGYDVKRCRNTDRNADWRTCRRV